MRKTTVSCDRCGREGGPGDYWASGGNPNGWSSIVVAVRGDAEDAIAAARDAKRDKAVTGFRTLSVHHIATDVVVLVEESPDGN